MVPKLNSDKINKLQSFALIKENVIMIVNPKTDQFMLSKKVFYLVIKKL